jgi:hypothetical protein
MFFIELKLIKINFSQMRHLSRCEALLGKKPYFTMSSQNLKPSEVNHELLFSGALFLQKILLIN